MTIDSHKIYGYIFCIKVASLVIEVHAVCSGMRELFSDWLTDEEPDIKLSFCEEDLALWRKVIGQNSSDEKLEWMMLYHRLAHIWPDYDILQIHSACVALDGNGYLFSAREGTGKSTHTRLWREQLGAVSVNDDMPLLQVTDNGVCVHSQPYDDKSVSSVPGFCVPLKAICLIHRDYTNHIKPITIKEAYPEFLFRVYPMYVSKKIQKLFDNGDLLAKTFPLVDEILSSVKLYSLGCTQDPEAAFVAYKGMNVNE